MRIRCLSFYLMLVAGAIQLDAGASGGGGTLVTGTVTPGPGASFAPFQYAGLPAPAPIAGPNGVETLLAGFPIELNALLAGPTDGTNVLNSIGFSNGSSQLIPGFVPWAPAQIVQAAAASGLIGSLVPTTASIMNVSLTVYFIQIGTFKFETAYLMNFTVGAPTMPVGIMIKPAAPPPVPINPGANGTIPVGILSAPGFDATTQVNRASLTFGHTGAEASLSGCDPGGQDVNGDGLPDLVCHFDSHIAAFVSGDTMGFLQGTTVSAFAIQGAETIKTVGGN